MLVALAASAAATFGGSSSALGSTCVYPTSYPGDNAAKDKIAAWMAGGAIQAGLPGELPVMAALVESNLTNLPQGDSTTAGYFQMRVDIWNSGAYAGFPDHPSLQLQWFIDQAQKVRNTHYANGDTTFGQSDTQYGGWAADVERPPEQYRGRYQLRLQDARTMIASGCATDDATQPGQPQQPGQQPAPDGSQPGQPAPDAQMIPDSVLPTLRVKARRYQGPARTGSLVATATCGNEDCLLRAAAAVAIPDHGIFRLSVLPRTVKKGRTTGMTLALTKRQRKLVSASVHAGECPLGVVRVIAANDGGWRISASRTVLLGPRRLCS